MHVSQINDDLDKQISKEINTKLEKFTKFLCGMVILYCFHSAAGVWAYWLGVISSVQQYKQ